MHDIMPGDCAATNATSRRVHTCCSPLVVLLGRSFWQPDRLAQLKKPKTIHFLNGFSSAMAPALRGARGTSEKTEIGAIAPPHARPPVQRRRPEAPARRRNRRTWENDKCGRG